MNSNKSDAEGPGLVVQVYGIDRACGRLAPWIRPLIYENITENINDEYFEIKSMLTV